MPNWLIFIINWLNFCAVDMKLGWLRIYFYGNLRKVCGVREVLGGDERGGDNLSLMFPVKLIFW